MKNTEGLAKSASQQVNKSRAKATDHQRSEEVVSDWVGSEIPLSGNVLPVVPDMVASAL
jgi:hypothetical protein